jgi:hypothetical protein
VLAELVKAQQSRIAELEHELAHYEAARITIGVELDYYRRKALGMDGYNSHRAALETQLQSQRILASLERICPECNGR